MTTRTYLSVTHTVVSRQGHLLDVRAAAYFDMLNKRMPGGITLIQGSFSTGEDASAGTHAGPGALDLKPASRSYRTYSGYKLLEKLSREQGGAAWFRAWSGNYHVHIIIIGTRGLPYVSRRQVQDYLNGYDGLVSHNRIYGVINTTWEKFLQSLKPVSATVAALQRAVRLSADGVWGGKTDNALIRVRAMSQKGLTWFKAQTLDRRKTCQRYVGVYPDGTWGTKTPAGVKATVIALQKVMGVPADGVWGAVTNARFETLRTRFRIVEGINYAYPYQIADKWMPRPGGATSVYGESGTGVFSGNEAGGSNSGVTASGNLSSYYIRAHIKQIQRVVGVTADGNFGPNTAYRVRVWQKAHGIPVDGRVGAWTWGAMARSKGQGR